MSALLLAISPWSLQIGRGAILDVDFALFFLLFGIYIFIAKIDTRKFLWSFIPFTFAFYSYHATKVFFVFLIPVLLFFYRKKLLEKKKETIIFICGCLLIVISFLIVIKTQSVTRQTDVSLLSDKSIAVQIDRERQYNSAPPILKTVFSNKPLYYLRVIRENYLEAFSTNFLFLYGDVGGGTQIDNIHYRGELYIIELPLLLLGVYWLFKNKNNLPRNLIFLLLLISPLPSTFTLDKSFVNRDIMMLPVLMITVAFGIDYLLSKIETRKHFYKYILFAIFVLSYLFIFSEYAYQYYYRWSTYGAEGWQKSYRDVTSFIAENQNNFSNIYVSENPQEFLLQYAITEKVDPAIVQKIWRDNPIKLYNITMFTKCLDQETGYSKILPKNTLYAVIASDCHYDLAPAQNIVDDGESLHVIWNIYENK